MPVRCCLLIALSLLTVPLAEASAPDRLLLRSAEVEVVVSAAGGALQHIRERSSNFEYLWQDAAGIWSGPAPVLFPIIGGLREKAIRWDGRRYPLRNHGFARDRIFTVQQNDATTVTLELIGGGPEDDSFPLPYRLELTYALQGRSLRVSANITNPGSDVLPVGIGFHPGLNVTFDDHATLTVTSDGPLIQLVKDPASGFLTGERRLWTAQSRELPLTGDAPGRGAIVLAASAPVTATLTDPATGHRVRLVSPSPYFGIWRRVRPGADFICLEPWWSTTDPVAPYDDLRAKPHLPHLAPGATLVADFTLEFN